MTPSTRQAPVGLAGDRWSLTVEGGLGSVDPNYVSFVVDPASLEILPKYPRYPYPVDFTSPALKALVKELALALFVITEAQLHLVRRRLRPRLASVIS